MLTPASISSFLSLCAQIISDPSPSDLERFLREGRLMTYRKFSMIRNRMLIAHKLNECIQRMAEMQQQQATGETTAADTKRSAAVSPILHSWHGAEESDPLSGLFPASRPRNLALHESMF